MLGPRLVRPQGASCDPRRGSADQLWGPASAPLVSLTSALGGDTLVSDGRQRCTFTRGPLSTGQTGPQHVHTLLVFLLLPGAFCPSECPSLWHGPLAAGVPASPWLGHFV